jgi:hypothetical protein
MVQYVIAVELHGRQNRRRLLCGRSRGGVAGCFGVSARVVLEAIARMMIAAFFWAKSKIFFMCVHKNVLSLTQFWGIGKRTFLLS